MAKRKSAELYDFDDDNGPVPAHRHENGGGWVANTANVAETAYVGENAVVFGDANVWDYAMICDNAVVCDNACIYNHVVMRDDALVCDDAVIYDHAVMRDDAKVYGESFVIEHAKICGDAMVCDNAFVQGDAIVRDNAIVCGHASIRGNVIICDDVVMCGDAHAQDDAMICGDIIFEGKDFSQFLWKCDLVYGFEEYTPNLVTIYRHCRSTKLWSSSGKLSNKMLLKIFKESLFESARKFLTEHDDENSEEMFRGFFVKNDFVYATDTHTAIMIPRKLLPPRIAPNARELYKLARIDRKKRELPRPEHSPVHVINALEGIFAMFDFSRPMAPMEKAFSIAKSKKHGKALRGSKNLFPIGRIAQIGRNFTSVVWGLSNEEPIAFFLTAEGCKGAVMRLE